MSTASEMLTRLVAQQETARSEREVIKEKRAAIVQLAEDEGRDDLNESEDAEFRTLSDELKAADEAIIARDARIAELADEEKRAENADRAFKRAALTESQVRVTSEAKTYERGNGQSYFKDMALSVLKQDHRAQARLERHAQESEFEARTNPNRTSGEGGYFVPPVWLMDSYAEYLRAGRAVANAVGSRELPGGTDNFNIPKLATGSTAAIQTADAAAVSSTDITDSTVSASVRTIAGQQDIAIQLLEQSPLSFDEIIFQDLISDLNMKLDQQVISGSGASGQVLGLLSVTSGVTTVSVTTTTVTALYSKIAGAINTVHTSRYQPPDTIVMHPRRWAWLLAATDTTGRPFVIPTNVGNGYNPLAGHGGVTSEGYVGKLQGVDVFIDANMPSTAGSGTNEDKILVFRRSDPMLWEGALNTRVLPEVLSNTLQVRVQIYKYVAFTAERYPQSLVTLTGTGLTAPSF